MLTEIICLRSDNRCWILARGLYDHCLAARTAAGCSYNACTNIWKNFVEACHRLRSLNTNLSQYRVFCCANKDKPCMTGSYDGLGLYNVGRM